MLAVKVGEWYDQIAILSGSLHVLVKQQDLTVGQRVRMPILNVLLCKQSLT